MPTRMTHDLRKDRKASFRHDALHAYLAILDADTYTFFVSSDLDHDGMLSHLSDQMDKRTCVAWGCPEAEVNVRVVLTADGFDSEIVPHTAGFRRWLRTDGRLFFTSHADLFHCATNADWSLFALSREQSLCSREFIVYPGLYGVDVFRHFAWFDGAQYAEEGVGALWYTVKLHHSEDDDHPAAATRRGLIPWT